MSARPDPPAHPSRRTLLGATLGGLGAIALGAPAGAEALRVPHFPPRARRGVFLFMSGGPSQLETFDPKPLLNARQGEELPESVRRGQRLTGMSGNQSTLPLAGSVFGFARHGESGAWVSELLPHTARVVDELCIVRSLYTGAINHDPAITFLLTGAEQAGRPSLPAWLGYGLGSENADLPEACVLVTKDKGGQPLYARLWGAGFLPTRHQGVQLRGGPDPVLYLDDPPGVTPAARRLVLDALGDLSRDVAARDGTPEALERLSQYELAWRMQRAVPEVADLASEPEETFRLYGEDARVPGTFAANCLFARRLLERGVRSVHLFHKGWDQHGNLPRDIQTQCRETDQASAALVVDLQRRGLLDDTLVFWGGEFGRTAYCQGKLTVDDYGRDHHPLCFSAWMAGGGVRAGTVYGETDEFGYRVVRDPVHVHDLQATILYLFGIDHERLVYRHQGRRFRLTDVEGQVVRGLLA